MSKEMQQVEETGLTQEFIKENNKETLAQVFTDVRYKKEDNVLFSKALLDTLQKQWFMVHP